MANDRNSEWVAEIRERLGELEESTLGAKKNLVRQEPRPASDVAISRPSGQRSEAADSPESNVSEALINAEKLKLVVEELQVVYQLLRKHRRGQENHLLIGTMVAKLDKELDGAANVIEGKYWLWRNRQKRMRKGKVRYLRQAYKVFESGPDHTQLQGKALVKAIVRANDRKWRRFTSKHDALVQILKDEIKKLRADAKAGGTAIRQRTLEEQFVYSYREEKARLNLGLDEADDSRQRIIEGILKKMRQALMDAGQYDAFEKLLETVRAELSNEVLTAIRRLAATAFHTDDKQRLPGDTKRRYQLVHAIINAGIDELAVIHGSQKPSTTGRTVGQEK